MSRGGGPFDPPGAALTTPDDLARAKSAILELFPSGVVVHVLKPTDDTRPTYEAERRLVAAAAPVRKGEFAAGRVCAAQALRELGAPSGPLLMRPDRSPAWPEGVAGSISHCNGFCVAVTAWRSDVSSLGVDVECDDDLSSDVASYVCRPDELAGFAKLPRIDCSWEKLTFSAKESFYKCYSFLTAEFLDFHDVRVDFSAASRDRGAYRAELLNPLKPSAGSSRALAGQWWVAQGRVHVSAYTAQASS